MAQDSVVGASSRFLSGRPMRLVPPPSVRPMADGRAVFCDPRAGRDSQPGSQDRPWRTINHACRQLQPGDTLYLRGGTYYENVYCSVVGTADAPVTIRSYPGEQAVLDGGFPEFQENPAKAWVPTGRTGLDEFCSARRYRNIRDVVGLFADSHLGLQTYWHAEDLRAVNELWIKAADGPWAIQPVYCGPGLWYDKVSGYIHCRLAHTHLATPGLQNYEGETDPRRLPLVVAAFDAVPLFVDQAMHVRFQDLVIRGGGHNTLVLQFGVDLDFDNVTVFGGTYVLRARGTGPLRMIHCGFHGQIPPWAWVSENALQTYTPAAYDPFSPGPETRGQRNIARLPTHAVMVTEGGYEFEVFYYPHNHDWDVSYCEFTDGHDGPYVSGRRIRFHHNWVDNMQDDGIYLSSPTPYISDDVHVYQNLVTRAASALALHSRGGPDGNIYVYRNIIDLRRGVHRQRPTPENPAGEVTTYQIFLMHGREFLGVESIYLYQNTFLSPSRPSDYALRTLTNTGPRTRRVSLNNIFVYLSNPPTFEASFVRTGLAETAHDIRIDGNLHWCMDGEVPTDLLPAVRACPASRRGEEKDRSVWEASSFVADPGFRAMRREAAAENDYRLLSNSRAIGSGTILPDELEDPLRPAAGSKPDIGALPADGPPFAVGRWGRVRFPIAGAPEPRSAGPAAGS